MKAANAFLDAAQTQSVWIAETLRKLVLVESPSDNKPAVDEAVQLTASLAEAIGGRVKLHKQKQFGDILEARFGAARSSRKPILLLGHLDTVWPLGTLRTMPWRREEGRFFGPGVFDMKAGVTMALAAIRMLGELGVSRAGSSASALTLLLNSDEEMGSPVSRPITERLALRSEAVLVLEPAQGLACKPRARASANTGCMSPA